MTPSWLANIICSSLIICYGNANPRRFDPVFFRAFNKAMIDIYNGKDIRLVHSTGSCITDSVRGLSDPKPDEAGELFLSLIGLPRYEGAVLDIAGGWSTITHEALNRGAKRVLMVEMSRTQLAWAYGKAPEKTRSRVTMVYADFPNSFPDKLADLPFSPEQKELQESAEILQGAGLIFSGQFGHYKDMDELRSISTKFHKLSHPNAVVIMTAGTPYSKKYQGFIREFEDNVKNGVPNPGKTKASTYMTEEEAKLYSDEWMYLLNPQLFESAFHSDPETPWETFADYYPAPPERTDLTLDGRERVYLIAWKKGTPPPFDWLEKRISERRH
jgi:hypothetical protein